MGRPCYVLSLSFLMALHVADSEQLIKYTHYRNACIITLVLSCLASSAMYSIIIYFLYLGHICDRLYFEP